MDDMIYMLMCCGSVEQTFSTREELDKAMREACEREKQYEATHYYYSTKEMPLGKFVCDTICYKYEDVARQTKINAERYGKDERKLFLSAMWSVHCRKCPFNKHSPYWEGRKDGKNN